ncbi:uncharacterized protein LOC129587905 [Paramacrobiotus metropolitanus]|uniref:uncharacterized protein LOC129587905 n=1 Tax=Paramacrobiotus metropolitanus TaxID=2943436 RepID=UPI0024460B7F|nr:uncharacterized protein LOC129587905 [Paramacrobiotus metropolitanus]
MRVLSDEMAHYLRNMENQPAAVEILAELLDFPDIRLDPAAPPRPPPGDRHVSVQHRLHLHALLIRLLDLLDYLLERGCLCRDACRLLVPGARIFRALALSIHMYTLKMEHDRLIRIACLEMHLAKLSKGLHVSDFAQRAFVEYFATFEFDRFATLHDHIFQANWQRDTVVVSPDSLNVAQPLHPEFDRLMSVDKMEDNLAHYHAACGALALQRQLRGELLDEELEEGWRKVIREDTSLLNLSQDVELSALQGNAVVPVVVAKKGEKAGKKDKKTAPDTPITVPPFRQLIVPLVRNETHSHALSLLQSTGAFSSRMNFLNGVLREDCTLAALQHQPNPLQAAVQAAEEAERERLRAIQPMPVYASLLAAAAEPASKADVKEKSKNK